jgi:hyperosmotically inducible protein
MRAGAQTRRAAARTMHQGRIDPGKHFMTSKFTSACFVIGTLFVPFAVHAVDATASDADRTHPKVFVKDSVITTKIKTRLAEEKAGSLARIHVDTHGRGVVVLTGKVRSKEEADRAISIARATEGVTMVSSRMRIKKDE